MEENIYIKIGQTIKSLRNKNNMTLTQFGNIVGVSAAAVSKWESGEGIKTESLMKISNYFNIKISDLLVGSIQEAENNFIRNTILLSHADFDVEDEEYIHRVSYYLECLQSFIKQYLDSLVKTTKEYLTEKEANEIETLSKHLIKEKSVCSNTLLDISDLIRKNGCVNDEVKYELSRIQSFKLDLNPIDVLNTNDENLIKQMLSCMDEMSINYLLTCYIKDMDVSEMQESIPVRLLIESGAKCVYEENSMDDYKDIEFGFMEYFEGNIEENTFLHDLNARRYNYEAPFSWEELPYNERNIIIDQDKTEWITNVVLFRKNDPVAYVEKQLHVEDIR